MGRVAARRAGELVCVVGPNGAGKTTLINAIAGIQRARGGRDRRSTGATSRRCRRIASASAGIAIVPEGRRLFTRMTVRENLELGSYLAAAQGARGAQSLDACARCSRR